MNNRNTYTIKRENLKGETIEKIIKELSEDECKSRKLLGSSFGINIGHCVFMGSKYCEKFLERVEGYRIVQLHEDIVKQIGRHQNSIGVEFYEKGEVS